MEFKSETFLLFFRDIVKYEVLSRKDEQILFKKYFKTNDIRIKNKIILSNLRFVFQEAAKFQWSEMTLLDLIEEGIIGLMKAIDKFNPDKKIRFISYAVWWIRQSIWDAIYSKGYIVKIPASIRKRSFDENLTDKQKNLNLLFQNLMNIIHYEKKTGEDSLKSLLSFLPASSDFSPDMIEEKISLSKNINKILDTLTRKERIIIKMRYGLDPYKKNSLQDIALFLDVTKERVRQIQNQALVKLKTNPITFSLRSYLEN